MATFDSITIKEEMIEAKLREVFSILDVKDTESNKDTAHRVAKMWVREVFRNNVSPNFLEELKDSIKTFPRESVNSSMIITTIPFHAFCEHHLLPFSGKAQIGYIPNSKIIGLSKIPRIVDYLCHTPQLQEKLCADIVNMMNELIDPNFVCVRLIAEHSCVACRGIERDCETDTFDYISRYCSFSECGKSTTDEAISDFYRRVGR